PGVADPARAARPGRSIESSKAGSIGLVMPQGWGSRSTGGMADFDVRARLSHGLTSRRGARIWLGAVLAVFVALFGLLSGAAAPAGNDAAPRTSESAQVDRLLEKFPDADQQSVLIVASASGGSDLTDEQVAALEQAGGAAEAYTGTQASSPQVSEDGAAAVLTLPVTVGQSSTETAEAIEGLRTAIDPGVPAGLAVQVTRRP